MLSLFVVNAGGEKKNEDRQTPKGEQTKTKKLWIANDHELVELQVIVCVECSCLCWFLPSDVVTHQVDVVVVVVVVVVYVWFPFFSSSSFLSVLCAVVNFFFLLTKRKNDT